MTIDTATATRLRVEDVTLAYDERVVSTDLSVDIPAGSFTVIIGPNACGKSTLLRSLSRLLTPTKGKVLLDGKDLASYRPKEFARTVGLLPQTSIAPDGIKVVDLVSRGRFPYQGVIRQWRDSDEKAVADAMAATKVTELAQREVSELSGGQRQRVWAAMAVAQETEILLLDEPTTYLDLTHQIELLDLFAELHRNGTTIVAVLHELNLATRYADHLICIHQGEVVATGNPTEVMTTDLVKEVFSLDAMIMPDPVSDTPLLVPRDGNWSQAGQR